MRRKNDCYGIAVLCGGITGKAEVDVVLPPVALNISRYTQETVIIFGDSFKKPRVTDALAEVTHVALAIVPQHVIA